MSVFMNVPVWVWLILLFLIYRGVSALKPRQRPVKRLFIVPLIFFIIGVIHLDDVLLYTALLFYVLSMFLFCFIRILLLWGRKISVSYDKSTCSVMMPGSSFTLLLVLGVFLFKFIASFLLAEYPNLSNDLFFSIIYGAGAGIATGLSWGGLIYVFLSIKRDNPV